MEEVKKNHNPVILVKGGEYFIRKIPKAAMMLGLNPYTLRRKRKNQEFYSCNGYLVILNPK